MKDREFDNSNLLWKEIKINLLKLKQSTIYMEALFNLVNQGFLTIKEAEDYLSNPIQIVFNIYFPYMNELIKTCPFIEIKDWEKNQNEK